ncbi:MAG: DUF2066 domain-containing protein [Gammaproteobacteria bacterium]|nr:DUF2066 domain-containing protein [Gammaproteobacteria bacterium]
MPPAIAFSTALWCGTPACGEIVDWLYEVEVTAESRTGANQRGAARSALREMLMRMTGLKNVPMSQPIVDALNAPELYYVQYRFVQDGNDADQRLQVSFEPQAIQDLVAEASLPIWSADRPRVLAWLAIREDGPIRVLDSGSDHPLADSLRQRSRQRGVPLRLPLMDLEDRELISPPAVWDGFAYTLDAASRRYGAEVVLVGRAARIADDEWRTDWELWIDNEPRAFSYSVEDVEAGAAQAMDEVADELMQRLAVFGRDATAIEIAVRGAGSIGRYADLMRYLSNLEYIERVHLTAAGQETLTLRVVTRTTAERLAELLSKDGAFRRLPAIPGLRDPNRGDVIEDASTAPLMLLWSGKS